jgi:hypothetical protein
MVLITKDTKPMPSRMPKPRLKWQTEHFANTQEFRFQIPYGALLLCRLWGVTPNTLIHDFLNNLSHGSWQRQDRDEVKLHLRNYILQMNYGGNLYTQQQILEQFNDLDAIGRLWPENAKSSFTTRHSKWRDKYYNWWYKQQLKNYGHPHAKNKLL